VEIQIDEVLQFMKEQIGNQAQEIAVLKATVRQLQQAAENKDLSNSPNK